MALFKLLKGQSQNLPQTKTEGYAYFVTDTGEFYIDIDTSTRVQVNAEKLSRTRSGETEYIEIDDILLLQDHVADKNNPHGTSPEQIGADPAGSAASALNNAKEYTDQKIAQIPTPDVSAQINEHNISPDAHTNMGWITSDDGLPSEPTPINADTLGGIPANNYATVTQLNEAIGNINSILDSINGEVV